jgi:hypothetical protein
MANTNAPYGFRLYTHTSNGSGGVAVAPGKAAGGSASASGPIPFASALTVLVGDPIMVSAGLGYVCTTTHAIYGIANSAVPGWGETATAKHYPEIIPADDQTIFVAQAMGTTNVTQGYIAVAGNRHKIKASGTYKGIDMSASATGPLEVIGLAPWSAFGTYAELLVIVCRGAFYGVA